MSFGSPHRVLTFAANADFSTRQYHIVELTTTVGQCALASAGLGFGVLQNHPQSGEAASVAVGGETRVKAGGAITVGQWVTAANTGFAVAVTSGAVPTRAIGRALTGASSGSLATVSIRDTVTISGAAN